MQVQQEHCSEPKKHLSSKGSQRKIWKGKAQRERHSKEEPVQREGPLERGAEQSWMSTER